MKEKTIKLYIFLFVLLLVIPTAAWELLTAAASRAAARNGGDGSDTVNYENTASADRPVLSADNLTSFTQEVQSYYSENLPFRDQLLTMEGLIDYYVLHSTDTTSVLVGQDGWLFYRGNQANGEDPVADYKGTNLFTEKELSQIWMQMASAKNLCEVMDAQFAVMVVPSKARVYSDKMPESYGDPGDGRIAQVTEYLRQQGITVVNPTGALLRYRAEHPEEQLYRKYDTHWNRVGAYLAAQELDSALGVSSLPDLSEIGRAAAPAQNYDLARLMHLGQILTKDGADGEQEPAGYADTDEISCEMSADTTEYRYTDSSSGADARSILIIGDSFAPIMTDYVASDFQKVTMEYYYVYTPDMLETYRPDVVVYEVNERYLMNLQRFTLTDIMPVVQN